MAPQTRLLLFALALAVAAIPTGSFAQQAPPDAAAVAAQATPPPTGGAEGHVVCASVGGRRIDHRPDRFV